MEDMSNFAESRQETAAEAGAVARQEDSLTEKPVSDEVPEQQPPERDEKKLSKALIEEIKSQVVEEIKKELKASITKEVVTEIIKTLSQKFLGGEISVESSNSAAIKEAAAEKTVISDQLESDQLIGPTAAERLSAVKAFNIRKEKCEVPIWTVKLGATKKEGGTRAHILTVGGETCMPFHLWEGEMPNRPLVAMEVFDVVSEKYPPVLRKIYGELLNDPPQMAKVCVEKYGADLISVRLEGTHPEKGNRTPEQAAQLVKAVLSVVDVPIIVTGHNHFDSNNEVMKAVAQACAGENLLLNWVEQDNYRTIAGAALAYGHSIVSQSPIDVNIAKQMNILLTNMDVKQGQIVMDPLTGAMGYGIEYTYSVMERIRLTALNGDKMLAGPMIVSPGQECARIKELKAAEKDFPAWGDLKKRAAYWELTTAVSFLYAGADILIMYHPEAAMATKRMILKLMNGK
jgi:acetyl-CoA decarbonylase/synthase complex subunit delta